MNNYIFFVCASALALFIYFRYIHRDMMNLVDVAKTVSDRKKELPDAETMDLIEETMEGGAMEDLVKNVQDYVDDMDPDKNPLDEFMKLLRMDKIEEEEPEEDE